ncbi:hypothetical protein ACS0TY_020713 [Phlomoides rotata]
MKLLSYNIRGLGGIAKKNEIKDLIRNLRVDGCCIQETKLDHVDERMVRRLWGKGKFNWAFKAAEGNSGGLLSIWNAEKFQKSGVWEIRGMLVINGVLLSDGSRCTLINVYAPNNIQQRWILWENITLVVEQYKDVCVGIIGDFNALREPSERFGKRHGIDQKDMEKFEDFIKVSNLTEIQLIEKKYTWYRPDGTCKTKLDRLLVNEEWRTKCLSGRAKS